MESHIEIDNNLSNNDINKALNSNSVSHGHATNSQNKLVSFEIQLAVAVALQEGNVSLAKELIADTRKKI